jgi:hypothetical protein
MRLRSDAHDTAGAMLYPKKVEPPRRAADGRLVGVRFDPQLGERLLDELDGPAQLPSGPSNVHPVVHKPGIEQHRLLQALNSGQSPINSWEFG